MNENRVIRAFADLQAAGKKALVPFLTAGYPDRDATAALLAGIENRGVRVCELGIPFSDPIADGPTIQSSYTAALENGITVDGIFATVSSYRAAGGAMALLAMVSYSIVWRRGVAAFCRDAAAAGFDGLIVPDLPVEESAALADTARSAGLCAVCLIAPTTPPARRVALAGQSTGFVYFMSVAGITGERKELPDSVFDAVRELKQHTDTPVCIGFGISEPAMVRQAAAAGDGAIVGSAIIHRINDGIAAGLPTEKIVETVCDFVAALLEPIR